MEILVGLFALWVLWSFLAGNDNKRISPKIRKINNNSQITGTPTQISQSNTNGQTQNTGNITESSPPLYSTSSNGKNNTHLYKPDAYNTTKNIIFREPQTNASNSSSMMNIKDLVDAFTGAPLNFATSLFQCENCKVFYQQASYNVISEVNSGKCVSCQSTKIHRVENLNNQGRNFDPYIVTLLNYKQYEGQVITFVGEVYNVLMSSRGIDYAIMFENKNWTAGFKLVAFGGDIEKIGGEAFIYSLVGKKIKVRGLLINHERYGHEIIINEKSMILSTQ